MNTQNLLRNGFTMSGVPRTVSIVTYYLAFQSHIDHSHPPFYVTVYSAASYLIHPLLLSKAVH